MLEGFMLFVTLSDSYDIEHHVFFNPSLFVIAADLDKGESLSASQHLPYFNAIPPRDPIPNPYSANVRPIGLTSIATNVLWRATKVRASISYSIFRCD